VNRPERAFDPIRNPLDARAYDELLQLLGTRAYGTGRRRWPEVKPLLEIRCQEGHASARVYATRVGPLFVSWPLLGPEWAASQPGIGTTSPRGGEFPVADLLLDEPQAEHPDLLAWCRPCGIRNVPREPLIQAVRSVQSGTRRRRVAIF
jgi:hypothetical protein